MKRKIDPVAINSVGKYFNDAALELRAAQQKLINDISLIEAFYKGDDARLIMEKYTARVKQIDSVVENITRYAKYMYDVSGNHNENFSSSKKHLNESLNTLSEIPRINEDEEVY